MPFLNTLVLFFALCSMVAVPMFVGHGLSAHEGPWIPLGLAMGGLSALLAWVHVKLLRRRAAP
ncbi:MAG TPA: hypothetical protein VMK65_05810 [Longimicrobiales bacterium]|nr:hypothetical protein [Longimicrobiales bacterium]